MKKKVLQFFVLLFAFAAVLMMLQIMRFGSLTGFIIVDNETGSEADNLRIYMDSGISMKRGEAEFIAVDALNAGKVFLNKCNLEIQGPLYSWASSAQIYTIAPEEKIKFVFEIKVPDNAEIGRYYSDVLVKCDETKKKMNFFVDVARKDFELKILSWEKTDINRLAVNYYAEEFAGKYQIVKINYGLINTNELTVASGNDEITLDAGSTAYKMLDIKLPKDAIGDFELVLNAESGAVKNSAREKITISSSGLTGLAISESNKKTLFVFGAFLLLIAVLIGVMKYIRKHHEKTSYIPISGRDLIKLEFD